MRSTDTNTYNWLNEAPDKGIRPRDVVYFLARSSDGSTNRTFVFWNGIDPVTMTVIDGATGATINRDCVGDGALLSMDDIPLTSDLTVQTIKVSLSQIHETVQTMVRDYDIRVADVQIHRAAFDPRTNALVAHPLPHFVGKVNKAPVGTPSSGQEGSIDISVVGHIRELTRTNAAKKSDETQKRRSGDRFRQYNSTTPDVFWGLKKEKTGKNGTSSSSDRKWILAK